MNRRAFLRSGTLAAAGLTIPRRKGRRMSNDPVLYQFTVQALNLIAGQPSVPPVEWGSYVGFPVEWDGRSTLVLNRIVLWQDPGSSFNYGSVMDSGGQLMATLGVAQDVYGLVGFPHHAYNKVLFQTAWQGFTTPTPPPPGSIYFGPVGAPGIVLDPPVNVLGTDQPLWLILAEINNASPTSNLSQIRATFHGWTVDIGYAAAPRPDLSLGL